MSISVHSKWDLPAVSHIALKATVNDLSFVFKEWFHLLGKYVLTFLPSMLDP